MDVTETIFQVEKAELKKMSVTKRDVTVDLLEGQVLFAIDSFSLTANNITYATLGESLRYWNFFPALEHIKGIIPVWGFANVIASKSQGIEVGQRFYGYYPMASHLVVEPCNISAHGFLDNSHHRKALPKIYNQYTNTAADPLYRKDTEAFQMLMRPLFTTSFLLADFFQENVSFGADQLVLTSASSKTAVGTAMLLKAGQASGHGKTHLVGLTSTSNKEFVENLGCYDQVITYDDITSLSVLSKSAVIDFAGNGQLLSDLAAQLGHQLRYVCLVGVSHWDQRQGLEPVTMGPKPVLFFAPTQAEKRLAEWGVAGFHQRLSAAWSEFEVFSKAWLSIENHRGPEQVQAIYLRVLEGSLAPDKGHICLLSESD